MGLKKFCKDLAKTLTSKKFMLLNYSIALAGFGYGYLEGKVEEYNVERNCSAVIEKAYTEDYLENIVKENNTPKDAFDTVAKNIKFIFDDASFEDMPGKQCNRWYSLQESYSLGKGVCSDGAMAFAAMLSDNPEYSVQLFSLTPMEGTDGHALAVFRENGKWHYVSFNDGKGKDNNYSYFSPESYESVPELLKENFSHYKDINRIEYTPEQLKFGMSMNRRKI